MLGAGSSHVVAIEGVDQGNRLALALSPWVGSVRPLAAIPASQRPDWIFVLGPASPAEMQARLRSCIERLAPGGYVAMFVENRRGLHWLADWRPAVEDTTHSAVRLSLREAIATVTACGDISCRVYALLPHHDAPRAVIPVEPPCPPAAQWHALDQVWQRATPLGALVRNGLRVLMAAGLMRAFYPHYLVVGRRPT